MPIPSPQETGWVSGQQRIGSSQPPQYILDAIGGSYDQTRYRWNPDTMSLEGPEGSYYYGDIPDPSLGTQVNYGPGSTEYFGAGENPHFFLTAGDNYEYGTAAAVPGSEEYNQLRRDTRTRNTQGIARVASVVGGGAALGATGSGPVFGGSGAAAGTGAAQTFPYTAGGTVTATPLAGAGAGAAGAAGAAGGGGAAAAGGAAARGLPNWLTDYVLPGVNGLLGAAAADNASDAQIAAMDRAIAENARQYDTTRSDLMPWMDAGRDALTQINNPGNYFTQSPDYTFRRDEGTRDIGNTFAARGLGQSGNALRAVTEFNSNLAANEYGNWWNRQSSRAGLGQATATTLGGLGADSAAQTGNYLANQGNARASGVLGKYGALSGAGSDIYQNYLYRRRAA